MTRITIEIGGEVFSASLTDDRSPVTAGLIRDALPIRSVASQWGDEIYFEIPVAAELENGADRVSGGDLGYWPEGRCFCIFYGPTPLSRLPDEIIPASAVSVVGRIDRTDRLKVHSAGEPVIIRHAD